MKRLPVGKFAGRVTRVRGITWLILVIVVLLGLSIYALTPAGSTAMGRETTDLGMRMGLDLKGGVHLVYLANLTDQEDPESSINGTIDVIRNRVDVLGVSEPVIQKQGDDTILVQLAGITNITQARDLIGLTALLEFRKLDDGGNWVPATGMLEGKEEVLSSRYFKTNTEVLVSQDPNNYGQPLLAFEWTDEGKVLSEQVTGALIGKPLAIFLGNEPLRGLDGQVIAPIVQTTIKDKGQITGLSLADAQQLKDLLNAGRIPVPITPIFEKTVSPTLGADFIDKAFLAGIIGLAMVILFMIAYYRFPGVIASVALLTYVAIVLALFKWIPVTLTLAGLAGFVLSIGMAVDANVLIFERLKEELRGGRTLKAAIEAGFNRAWSAIWASNLSTIIITGILYWFGSSITDSPPVTGFAVTLFFGVVASMFSAIVVTRTLLRVTVRQWTSERLSLWGVARTNV